MSDYMAQISHMMQNNKSTVYVDFEHVMQVLHYIIPYSTTTRNNVLHSTEVHSIILLCPAM